MRQFRLDTYVMDTLMPDLVLHDRQPSAFLVYLQLSYQSMGKRGAVHVSHHPTMGARCLRDIRE